MSPGPCLDCHSRGRGIAISQDPPSTSNRSCAALALLCRKPLRTCQQQFVENAAPVNVLRTSRADTPAAPRCPDRPQIPSATPGYARLFPSHTKPGKRGCQGLGKRWYHFESAAQYERITLDLLADFQRVGEIVQPPGCMRTDIIRQFPPLPGRWTISGNIPFEVALEASGASWKTPSPAAPPPPSSGPPGKHVGTTRIR